MIKRRGTPDGLPFRLYCRTGERITSYGYKLADGTWAFRLSARTQDKAACARIRTEAINRANALNGDRVIKGSIAELIQAYFSWQESLPRTDERRKTDGTLEENKREAKKLLQAFGKMEPADLVKRHCYGYLDARAQEGAPAKANKEIALLSAVMEYGIRTGVVDENPCRLIKYNPVKPRTKTVSRSDQAFALREARRRGGSYLVQALGMRAAYLTVNRPDELRRLHRNAITPDGILISVGKRKRGQPQRTKLVAWSPRLRLIIKLALRLQRTSSMYVFANKRGQMYTRSGWSSNWRRLMGYCEQRATVEGVTFARFALNDMRPTAVTDRMDRGDTRITDATGNTQKVVEKIYDRRRVRKYKPTE